MPIYRIYAYYTDITLYHIIYSVASVLSAVFRNGGRSWNVLPVDTAVRLYTIDVPKLIGRILYCCAVIKP